MKWRNLFRNGFLKKETFAQLWEDKKKQCFLVCSRLGNFARKQCIKTLYLGKFQQSFCVYRWITCGWVKLCPRRFGIRDLVTSSCEGDISRTIRTVMLCWIIYSCRFPSKCPFNCPNDFFFTLWKTCIIY
jgi:hypothetical protein